MSFLSAIRKLKSLSRPAGCAILAIWTLLTSTGLILSSSATEVVADKTGMSKCCCSLKQQKSKSCCCFASKSCCGQSAASDQKQPEESSAAEHPEFNSYCGDPLPAGTIVDRLPRIAESPARIQDVSCPCSLVAIVSHRAVSSFDPPEVPPPQEKFELAFCHS